MRELSSHAFSPTIKTCAACQSKFGDKEDQAQSLQWELQGNNSSFTPPGAFYQHHGGHRHMYILVGSGSRGLRGPTTTDEGGYIRRRAYVLWVLEGFTQGPHMRIPEHRCRRYRVGDLFHGSTS